MAWIRRFHITVDFFGVQIRNVSICRISITKMYDSEYVLCRDSQGDFSLKVEASCDQIYQDPSSQQLIIGTYYCMKQKVVDSRIKLFEQVYRNISN